MVGGAVEGESLPSRCNGWEETDNFIPPLRLKEWDPPWGSVCAKHEPSTEPGGSTDSRNGVREATGDDYTAVTGNDSMIPSGRDVGDTLVGVFVAAAPLWFRVLLMWCVSTSKVTGDSFCGARGTVVVGGGASGSFIPRWRSPLASRSTTDCGSVVERGRV